MSIHQIIPGKYASPIVLPRLKTQENSSSD